MRQESDQGKFLCHVWKNLYRKKLSRVKTGIAVIL